jgi:hypothetical protein
MNVLLDTYALRVLEYLKQIPDSRTGKNTMYPFPQLSMTALAAFYSRAPSLRRFLDNVGFYRRDRGVEVILSSLSFGKQSVRPKDKTPTDNHIRKLLDCLDPSFLFKPIWDVVSGIMKEGDEPFRYKGKTLVVPYEARHYVSEKVKCPYCLTRSYTTPRRKKRLTEHFHSLLGFSLATRDHGKLPPQLPPEFIKLSDYQGYAPGTTYECSPGDKGPLPALPEILTRYLACHEEFLEPLSPVFVLQGPLGTFKTLSALGKNFNFIFIPNQESLNLLRNKAPKLYDSSLGTVGALTRREVETVSPPEHFPDDDESFLWNIGPALFASGVMGVRRKANLFLGNIPPINPRSGIVLTDLDIQANEYADAQDLINGIWTLNVPYTMKREGFGPLRRFGHGRGSLAEVFAALNILALNLYCLENAPPAPHGGGALSRDDE